MDAYERLYNSTDITMILDNINEMLNKVEKGMLRGCHGRYHAIGAALLIADKVDISKRRRLHVETIDDRYRNLLQIEDVDIRISSKAISINIITTEAFSKMLFVSEHKKENNLLIKAAKYLGCTCYYQFNGMEERLN